jgi:hypothetical protein
MKKLPPYKIAISPLDRRWRSEKWEKDYDFQKEWEFLERFERISRIHEKRVPNLDRFRAIFG